MATKVLGTENPFEASVTLESSDRDAATVVVVGNYESILSATPDDYCPSGYEVDTYVRASTGDGMGELKIKCVKYRTGTFGAARTTFRIDMAERQCDLEKHPHIEGERHIVDMWLVTDPTKRKSNGKYYYTDVTGAEVEVTASDNPLTYKFCLAYDAGIRTYMRYFPIIEKISSYNNPPGMSRSVRSFTGGSPTFSEGIGKYDTPPLTLSGYPATNWFKSKDSWEEQGDKTWRRVEQWTYTPESSAGTKGWVYNEL